MLQTKNETPFQISLGVFANEEGIECAYVAAKATFLWDRGNLSLAPQQLPIVPVDQYWGDPTKTSLKVPSDLTLSKPGTDVLLVGHAFAPQKGAKQGLVTMKVADLEKRVAVFGRRTWVGGFSPRISEPEPFEKVPLKFELAFGGVDPEPQDELKPDFEPRNPVGKGLVPRNSKRGTADTELPQLEDPEQLIRSPKDRPVPACFAAICPHWEPRKSWAGTYDEAWMANRAPYLPTDLDPRFFLCAPANQVVPGFLKGGEPVELQGVSPQGSQSFHLPIVDLQIAFRFDGKTNAPESTLDTAIIEPDQSRLSLVWRAVQVVDKKLLKLQEVRVTCGAAWQRKDP